MLDQKARQNTTQQSSSSGQAGKAAVPANTASKRKTDDKGSGQNKRARKEKHCNRCQEYGGAASTHNTLECRKYDKDGNLLPTFKSKKFKSDKGTSEKKVHTHVIMSEAQSIAQLAASVTKLEHRLKKQKVDGRRKKRKHEETSSDSTSS